MPSPADPSISPLALCEHDAVGSGTRVWPFAHVMAGAAVGAGCNIGEHAFIEAGARLGDGVTVKNGVAVWAGVTVEDDAFLGPDCVFTNDLRPRAWIRKSPDALTPTVVRRGATIGANATIVCGNDIGAYALVAAGAVVTRPVAAHALVAGNPARRTGWVCDCADSLDATLRCRCGRRFRLVDDATGLEPEPAELTAVAGPAEAAR